MLIRLVRDTAKFVEAQLNFSDEYPKKVRIVIIIQITLLCCVALSPVVGYFYPEFELTFWTIALFLLLFSGIIRLTLLLNEVKKFTDD